MKDDDRNNDDDNRPPPPAAAAASSRPTMARAGFFARTGATEYAAASARGTESNNNDNNDGDDSNVNKKGNPKNDNSDDDDSSSSSDQYPEHANESSSSSTTLKRLLHRLKREHESNFGKNSGTNSRPNKQRARYLLEASAGNVGLAAALYWEDYFLADGLNHNEQEGGNNNNDNESGSARKRQREDNNSHHHSSSSSATTTGAVAAAKKPWQRKKPARRKTSGLKDDDDNDDKPRGLSSLRQFEQDLALHQEQRLDNSSNDQERPQQPEEKYVSDLLNEAAALQAELASKVKTAATNQTFQDLMRSSLGRFGAADLETVLGAAAAAAGSSSAAAAAAPPPPNAAAANASSPAVAAARGGMGRRSAATAAAPPGVAPPPPFGTNNMNMASPQQVAAAAAAAAFHPNIMRLGLPMGEVNQLGRETEALLGSANRGSVAAANAGESFNAALAAALQGEPHLPSFLMQQQQQQQQQGGVGGVDMLSRMLANAGRLESEEARAFLAALAAESERAGGRNAAAAAAAGGNGGNPDDGDDDDDDDDNNGDDDNNSVGGGAPRDERDHERHARDNADDNNAAEAPLRRSLRLRSARRRDAARAAAMEIANRRANRRRNNDNAPAGGDHNVSGSDDETFMPGPIPVFRKKASAVKRESLSSKRKKWEDIVKPKLHLHGHSDDESDSADESVDIDGFLYRCDEYPDPSRVLWHSFPPPNVDGEDIRDEETSFIPVSWLRSGFKLSNCGNGLAMSEPNEEEWDDIRRSLPQNVRDGPLKTVKTLFPYNCKGVSAMLSLVTALLYAGVSLQNGAVSTDMDRVPFSELSQEERKKQFDQRLEDVLSSLIFVAAKAGSQRCKNKLAEYNKSLAKRKMNPEEQSYRLQMRQQLEKRTHLCNVCWWDVDSATQATIFPADKDPMDVTVNNSFTNINNIRSYVRTHLRSFKEPGGCVLLLETIIRCHGVECIEGMGGLLSCNCKESLKHVGSSNASMKSLSYDCMTPSLLSLLLTGEAHRSYQNWSGDIFGIGLLRLHHDEPPNNQLLRPLKQIWLCQGDTGYSTLFLEQKKLIGREDSLTRPGKAFHWNCWTAELSSMKISSTSLETESVSSTVSDDSDEENRTVMDSICAKIRKEHKRNLSSPWSNIAISSSNASRVQQRPITDEEVKSLKFHPEDEKYYPDQYRRWRFNFGSACHDSDIPTDSWIPFYRLNERQRLVVETKLAPRIVTLVRTRWPMAVVTDLSPRGQHPIV